MFNNTAAERRLVVADGRQPPGPTIRIRQTAGSGDLRSWNRRTFSAPNSSRVPSLARLTPLHGLASWNWNRM